MFISEVAGGEHSLDIAAGKAYTASLRRYHNWIIRGVFSVSTMYINNMYIYMYVPSTIYMQAFWCSLTCFPPGLQVAVRAVPYHKDFLVLLGSDGTADSNAAITVHMADFSRSLGEINSIINQFYQLHRLETSPIL